MKFVMEFAQNLILRIMEDPEARERKHRQHLYDYMEGTKKARERHRLPIRPYGFWTFDRHNSQLFWDPQISNAPGRRDPYDEVLEEIYQSSK